MQLRSAIVFFHVLCLGLLFAQAIATADQITLEEISSLIAQVDNTGDRKFACTCPLAAPAASDCDWSQGKCSSRNCFESKRTGGADCSPHFTGAYCGCEITCQLVRASGVSEKANPKFNGPLTVLESECVGSVTDLGDGDKVACVAVKFLKKAETDQDASGFKTHSCR